jgi:hypothetical protein
MSWHGLTLDPICCGKSIPHGDGGSLLGQIAGEAPMSRPSGDRPLLQLEAARRAVRLEAQQLPLSPEHLMRRSKLADDLNKSRSDRLWSTDESRSKVRSYCAGRSRSPTRRRLWTLRANAVRWPATEPRNTNCTFRSHGPKTPNFNLESPALGSNGSNARCTGCLFNPTAASRSIRLPGPN